MKPISETQIVELLLARIGRPTRIIAADGEPLVVHEVVEVSSPSPPPLEVRYHAELGGIPISADHGRYWFYSTEVVRIEDAESGNVLFNR